MCRSRDQAPRAMGDGGWKHAAPFSLVARLQLSSVPTREEGGPSLGVPASAGSLGVPPSGGIRPAKPSNGDGNHGLHGSCNAKRAHPTGESREEATHEPKILYIRVIHVIRGNFHRRF